MSDISLDNKNLKTIFSFIDDSVSIIEEQSKKIACLSEQVVTLSDDNKKLRKEKLDNEKFASQTKVAHSMELSKKTANVINRLNKLGFIKNASINGNLSDDFLNNPKQMLDILENMSETMIDLGLAGDTSDDSMDKIASFSPVDFLHVDQTKNKQKSNTLKTNLAASEYESNLRNKIASENLQREEVFLKTFNK